MSTEPSYSHLGKKLTQALSNKELISPKFGYYSAPDLDIANLEQELPLAE